MQEKLQPRLLKRLKMQKTIAFACGLLAMMLSTNLQAQTTVTVGTGTAASGANVLFSTNTGGNLWSKSASLYTAAEIINAGGTPGNITKIAFNKQGTGEYTFGDANLSIYIKAVSKADQSGSSLDWATNLGSATPLYSSTTQSFMTGTGWQEFNLQTPFLWDGSSNIEVLTAFHHPTQLTANMTWQYTVATNMNMSRVNSTEVGSQTMFLQSNRPNIQFTITPATPCTTPPTAGTATTSATTTCSGASFNLNLTGASFGSGQTYQWERSANGTSGWTPIGTSSPSPVLSTTQTAGTFFYRAAVTCSGQTAHSTTVSVSSPALVAGTFTINNNAPASATNFQTFAAAISSLNCGIGGPVIFNVDAASGPYNEQFEIPEIAGASATNTITFNGNGRTLTGDPVTGNRAMIRLNGADYVTINNLNIETTGTATASFGWGIHFINGADNNTISNNTITIGSPSTTESSTAGIAFTNSNATITTTGGNTGNNNVITGNTIIGGWKGIQMNSANTNPGNNQFTNNTIRDFYTYGIEINGANGTLFEGNNISRPNRATVIAFYGVYLSGAAQNSIISKNRIHNTHGGATSLTTAAYGVFSTSNDAQIGSENIVKNNLIYNFNGTGTIYAFNNTGSDGIYYYHNTVNFDNTANTGTARGLFQTTSANNIKFINNNVVIATGGAATSQHAIYLATAASTVESNRNNLYVPTGHVGFTASGRLTLADWQAANTTAPYDLNSVSVDPMFVNVAGGNFQPTNGAMNNIGQPLTAVTDDITGATRNTTGPDPGAYEFTPASLDLGVTALVAPAAQNCFGNAEQVTVTVQNFGNAPVDFSTVTANVTVTITGAATPTPLTIQLTNAMNGGQPLAPGATMNVPVGTVNMATAGAYTFNATTNITAGGSDGNAANNAMAAVNLTVSPLAAGTASATNTQICQSGVTTLNLTGNTGGNVQWQSGTSATGPFTNIAGATGNSFTLATPITTTTYYQAVTSCGTNSATSNVLTVTVSNPTAPTVAAVSRCGAGTVTLTATAATGSLITWYNAATGGAPLDTGSFSPNVTATTTFYATASAGGGTFNVGAASNAIGAGGATGTLIYYQIFDVISPLTLNHVYVYPAAAGNVVLHLSNNAGTVLQTFTLPVTAADVNQKTLVPINYALPAGTGYRLGWYTGSVNLYRNTAGATYPYTQPGVISITGNSFATGPNYWYYVYDFQVTSGCESARTPVVVTVDPKPATPTVTRAGNVLTSSAATGNQWYLNGTAIAGATGQTYTATSPGSYTVVSTGGNNCASDPSTAVAVVTGLNDALAGMSVQVYPNPASGSFNVKLEGYQKDASVVLYNLAGQQILSETASANGNAKAISLKGLAAGTYMLKVTSDKGTQVTRLVIQ